MGRKTQVILYFVTVLTGTALVLYWTVAVGGPRFAPVIWMAVCYLGFNLVNSTPSDAPPAPFKQKLQILLAAVLVNGGLLLAGYWQFHGGGPKYAFEAYILFYGLLVWLIWGRKTSKEPK